MATKTLEIAIVGTNKGATKAFKEVDAAAGTTESKLRQLGDTIGPAVATAAAAVVGAVGLALRGAFNAAQESAKIGRETERVLNTTGAAAWTTADQVGDLAQSMSELTGVDDELIQSGGNLLLTFTQIKNQVGEGNDIFNQATAAALDMSTALGTDMKSAALQVGKALNNPISGITALSRAGVSFTEQQKEQIRTLAESGDILGAQKIILAELAKEFGGAAEAAATPVDKLKVKLGNLAETVGTSLTPYIDGAVGVFSTLLDSFMALPGPVKTMVELLGAGTVGIGGAVLATSKIVSMFGDSIKPVMDFARRQFDNAALAVGEMAAKMTGSQTAGANLASSLSSAVVPAIGGVMAAATLAFGIWTMYQQGQAEAEARARAFTETLDSNTGAITKNSEAHIEKTLADKNQIDNLERAGITVGMYTNAVADNSHKLAANRAELYELATGLDSSNKTQYEVLQALKDEGGARNDLIVTLVEQGALDRGLVGTILEQVDAYDKNLQKIRDKVAMQALSTGASKAEAAAAGEAAAANTRHADALRDVADELRKQTDPYFAALKAQEDFNAAQQNYVLTSLDSTKSTDDKKRAYVEAAKAGLAYKGELSDLKVAELENGATTQALEGHLKDLAALGLDPAGKSAQGALGDFKNLKSEADRLDGTEVAMSVRLEMKKVQERLDWLKSQMNPYASADGRNYIPLEALYAMPFAMGGMVPDGLFMVGEQGPELGVKSGDSVRIFSNPDTRRMLAPSSTGGSMGRGDVNVYVNQPKSSAYEIGRELRWTLAVTG